VLTQEAGRDLGARHRIAEALRTNGDYPRSSVKKLAPVGGGCDAAHRDDWQFDRSGNGARLGQRDRSNGRPRLPAGAAAEPSLTWPPRVEGEGSQRVD
jgi:hypothetical protein